MERDGYAGAEKGLNNEVNMSTELVAVEHPLVIAQQLIAKGANISEIQGLWDLASQFEKNQAAKKFAEAMTKFQSLCPEVTKRREATGNERFGGYKYAGFDDVMAVAKPHLRECELVPTFTSEAREGGIFVTCRIRCGTHVEETSMLVPVPQMKVNDTQRFGAALQYAKRYCLCAALNIVVTDEDNDAQRAEPTINDEQLLELHKLLDKIEPQDPIPNKVKEWAKIDKWGDMPLRIYPQAMKRLEAQAAKYQGC